MLAVEENELLTRIGPATPMGEVLRRYWHPVGCSEWVTRKPQRIKVLGEELVLYRGESARPTLMQLRCAHRNVALDYGRVEGDCLRCPYHGWLYDATGKCLEQPTEPAGSRYKDEIRLRTYPTQERGGLVFAYMGPEPTPLLPLYDLLCWEDGVRMIQVGNVNANWMNHVENIVDISHLAWLHGYTFPAYGGKRVTYHGSEPNDNVMQIDGIEDTHRSCYGFPLVNRFALPPVQGSEGELVRSMIYRVPVDDHSTLLYFLRYYPSEKRGLHLARQENKLGEYRPLAADWWGIDVNDQDRMAVEQQGVVADRTKEHLAVSDGRIVLMRRMMREALSAVAAGRDPPCIIRDPARQSVDFHQRSTMMVQKQGGVGYAVGDRTHQAALAK